MSEPIKLDISFVPQEKLTLRGFKQEWISGSGQGVGFMLYAGAGCGNPYMEISVKTEKDNESVTYELDMRAVVEYVVCEHMRRKVF